MKDLIKLKFDEGFIYLSVSKILCLEPNNGSTRISYPNREWWIVDHTIEEVICLIEENEATFILENLISKS